jgi:hypothetical protein
LIASLLICRQRRRAEHFDAVFGDPKCECLKQFLQAVLDAV